MRLIDVNNLKQMICNDKEKLFKLRNTCITLSDKEVNDCQSYIYNRMLNIVGAIIAVDAVPVVRCKDCKHYQKYNEAYGECLKLLFDRYTEDCESNFEADMNQNDFCSYGERKEKQ